MIEATKTSSRVNPSSQQLEIQRIVVRFGGLTAIDEVSFAVRPKDILGLIGPNGAGKTTIVNVFTGFQSPISGCVVLDGQNITNWLPHRRSRHGLVRTFQAVRLFRGMNVSDNLRVAAIGAGLGVTLATKRANEILDWVGFAHQADKRADSLPYGDERRIGIARALATAPRYVLLDEPAAGLSDAECDELMKLIAGIPEHFGCGVLLIEHNMRVIMGVCNRIHVVDGGRTVAEGNPDQIQKNPNVVRAYLGSQSGNYHARR